MVAAEILQSFLSRPGTRGVTARVRRPSLRACLGACAALAVPLALSTGHADRSQPSTLLFLLAVIAATFIGGTLPGVLAACVSALLLPAPGGALWTAAFTLAALSIPALDRGRLHAVRRAGEQAWLLRSSEHRYRALIGELGLRR